jgi:DNA-binding response OmpR family regulator
MESSANSQQSVSGDPPPVLSFGEFMLDRERQCLTRAGERVALKPKVYDLLCLLLEQHGRVLSRKEFWKRWNPIGRFGPVSKRIFSILRESDTRPRGRDLAIFHRARRCCG